MDSADPEEVQDGQTLSGVYNHNNVFRKTDARAHSVPPKRLRPDSNTTSNTDRIISSQTVRNSNASTASAWTTISNGYSR